MIDASFNCPLCSSADTGHFCTDKLRDYLRCGHCQLVFVAKKFHLSAADERAQYDHHDNNPNDSGYRKFLGRLAVPLLQRLTAASEGLDFGCGPGPCLSVILEEQGHSVDLYDLYYADNKAVFERQYDFITATEVVEHLSQPMTELQRLWDMLRPGGYLGLMTKLVIDAEKFSSWHYKTDPTHISFFSNQSFQYLGQHWGTAPVILGADVIIFQKPQDK
jgi:2-polyprenyl-3-methyl-5-hydroxy-6-metoxy-1,4-benzoquinol methylase